MIPKSLLALASLAVLTFSAAAQTGRDTGNSVRVWLTTADRTALVAEQAPIPLRAAAPAQAGATLEIQPAQRFQTMLGFGHALTGGSAELLRKMSPAARHRLLEELFGHGPHETAMSYLRVSIGASDMNSHVYTYDDMPAGETDPTLAHFSLGPDLADVVPVLREILAINPKLPILASPWTAPSWMKTNGNPKAGALKPEFYPVYAQYFVRYLRAMQAKHIAIAALTMQNEPENDNNTPSMLVTAPEEAQFLATALGPALRKAGLHPQVILFDHNCDHPIYPLTILRDPAAAQYAAGTGFHLYYGDVSAMTEVHDAFPDKSIYFTEQNTTQDNSKPLEIAESVSRLMISVPRNWARNVLLWNLAADPNDGPHTDNGGCPSCQGALTLAGDQVTRNLAYYTVAQVSPFVPAGSVRIGSTADGVPANVAYRTPDGHTVLIAANPTGAGQTFTVQEGSHSFTAELPAGAAATYVWR